MSNYPDNVSAGDPSAPWNQPDHPDGDLYCTVCDGDSECTDDQIGDPCSRHTSTITDLLTTDDDPDGEPCPGNYQSRLQDAREDAAEQRFEARRAGD